VPRIFDNIELSLLPALAETLKISQRADFCVGYFNLRGWRKVDDLIDPWSGTDDSRVRLLVGMQTLPQQELRQAMSLMADSGGLDQQSIIQLKKRAAEEFREQLIIGAPSNSDEAGLRRLSEQIKAKKVIVKLYLRNTLHAKLYLCHRADPNNPTIAFVGSSNLTFSGLAMQGELNVDVLDHDACEKLQRWFNDRWDDRWCLDISEELAAIIDESWARERQPIPYHLYLKIAYHLSQEARAGLSEFQIPNVFGESLLEFQAAAVKIAAHHINKRGGVLLGDVVGLGKTLMATALARIFQDDQHTETLIICPKNLVKMWQDYVERYRMLARVMPLSLVTRDLSDLRPYRVVIIDESHNLRNRQGKRFKVIQDYIGRHESKCILLSATPYNKTYLDLSAQLRLFVPEDLDLGMRPEKIIRELSETEFIRRYQAPVRSLAAFEKSPYPDDWRELMRLYLVRRTRSFIQDNYSRVDPENGRPFLTFESGNRFYFPVRRPKTVKFQVDENNEEDLYGRLQSAPIVDAVNGLDLPRYGIGNYITEKPKQPPTNAESRVLKDLSRGGKRLMGFCRTNLFKRLESGGPAFILSLQRHALRNYVFLYAIDHGLPLPLGTQDAELLDANTGDLDPEIAALNLLQDDDGDVDLHHDASAGLATEAEYLRRAADIYGQYAGSYSRRFRWIRPNLFASSLRRDLLSDAQSILQILESCGPWHQQSDAKLQALRALLADTHPESKVLIFTQYADTVRYLRRALGSHGIECLAAVTGESADPTGTAWRFSPRSNNKATEVRPDQEIRVLIATDVLSEGQNLQDCSIIVNYDLPWAIIRLIQRAGRVDRIGQTSSEILCYSFLPSDGIERIIRLRGRVRARLRENAEVVGTDEAFFEDDDDDQLIVDLYNEKANILDGDADTEVDLASFAYQIWKNAVDQDESLAHIVPALPSVVYSTKQHRPTAGEPGGVLVYVRTAQGNDALAWVDKQGLSVTESQFAILRAAECGPGTPAQVRRPDHHDLVRHGAEMIASEERTVGGQLGRPSGARFRTYERLKRYAAELSGTMFESQELLNAIDEIYRYPLRPLAVDTLNRQLKSGISDAALADLVVALREDGRLGVIHENDDDRDPEIICSLGLTEAS
jgi:Helicase conserved C-terminal domain/PLD-like domain/SNF2-related domain